MKLEAIDWRLGAVDVSDVELFQSSSQTQLYTTSYSTLRPLQNCVRKGSPETFKNLALEAFLDQLRNLCLAKNYGENKRALKHYLKFQLPSTLRQQLLDLAMKENRIYTLIDLYLFELLLSTNVKYVKVDSVRTFFREQFVTTLRQLGSGLEHLIIHDSCWLQHRESLSSALSQMTLLRKVSLQYLANDTMFAALARHCHVLEEIDVNYSVHVTDGAIKMLHHAGYTQSSPITTPQNNRKERRHRKRSAPVSRGNSSGCMIWFPRLVRSIRNRSTIESTTENPVDEAEREHYSEKGDETDNASLNKADRNNYFRLLRRLEILGTSVTQSGVHLALAMRPNVTIIF